MRRLRCLPLGLLLAIGCAEVPPAADAPPQDRVRRGPVITYESTSPTGNAEGELDQVLGNIDGQNQREANFAANTAAALESPPMRGGNFSSFEQATKCTSLLTEAEEAVAPCAQELFVDLCGDGKGHYHGSECPRCEDLLAKDSKLSEAGCPARIRYPPYRL